MAFFKPQAIERAEQIMRENKDKDTGISNWDAWNAVCDQIMTKWSLALRSQLLPQTGSIIYPIEAKALHIFTFVQKHICAVNRLVSNAHMKTWYVQSMMLLLPIIELVGTGRLSADVKKPSNKTCLTAGAFWLFDPESLNNQEQGTLSDTNDIISLFEVTSTRNYLLHGVKTSENRDGSSGVIYSYQIPEKWLQNMQPASWTYWQQLTDDEGSNSDGWICRLARADIYPFRIPGAIHPDDYFEDGYIAPNILRFLA